MLNPPQIAEKVGEPMSNVSVVMATYNGGRFLRAQLDSLFNQTVLPFELIVADDGSTDENSLLIGGGGRGCADADDNYQECP